MGEPAAVGAIAKVCVIGAGVMGAGIAAQIANGGTPVLLLDLARLGEADRASVARAAIARMLKTEPAPFMSKAAARLVEVGTMEDDLARVAECDWIIEAVIERLEIKQDLYRRLDAVRRPGTAVSSNTSTIPLARLTEGMGEAFRRDFLITHFFNPPRYMRLLERVTSPETDPALAERVGRFCDERLGKTVVEAKDTPGFIANRIGTLWMQLAVAEAIKANLTVEEADAVMGRPFGFPSTGVFGLLDLVGIDLMPHVDASMRSSLPQGDAYHESAGELPLVTRMIAGGYTGRKGLGGFYRINRTAGKVKESIGLLTGEYQPSTKFSLPAAAGKDARALLAGQDKYADYAWRVMSRVLAYAASLVPTISDGIAGVDEAMRLGFNWKKGPFELLDTLGPKAVADRLRAEGRAVPPLLERVGEGRFYRVEDGRREALDVEGGYRPVERAAGVLLLEDVKLKGEPLLKSSSASAWDIGDGVVCFEITTKMNTFDEGVLTLLTQTVSLVKKTARALVIYTDAKDFSAGANIGLALFAANIAAWGEVERSIEAGQRAFKALKYAPFPVVAAPAGLALGGGCEICLHADAVVAHAETYMGLVEAGVGVVPGWGGCGELIARGLADPALPKGPMPAVARAFETIATAKVSKSAAEARELMFLRPADRIVMNRDRLLHEAKARALELVEGYAAPPRPEFRLPGPSGQVMMEEVVRGYRKTGQATPHDEVVARELAGVLTGGDADLLDLVSEPRMLELEREAFMRLFRTAATLDRVEHMLATGKPLRN